MDTYYAGYFADFAPDRPYLSLIVSRMKGELALAGRVWWRGEWLQVDRFCVERTISQTWDDRQGHDDTGIRERTARLNAALGNRATARLREAKGFFQRRPDGYGGWINLPTHRMSREVSAEKSTVEDQELAVCDILSAVWDSEWKFVLGRQDREARDENASVANNGRAVAGH